MPNEHRPSVIAVVGPQDSGKTTLLHHMLTSLLDEGKTPAGIVTRLDMPKDAYWVTDVGTGQTRRLLCSEPFEGSERFFRFYLDPTVASWANDVILARSSRTSHLFFDEVGRLELEGRGLAPSFRQAIGSPALTVVVAVRDSFLSDVVRTFGIGDDQLTVVHVPQASGSH